MKTIKKILFATDFSELSAAAVEYAETIAENFASVIYVAHVVDSVPAIHVEYPPPSYALVSQAVRTKAMKSLENFVAKNFRSYNKLKFDILEGHPDQELVLLAQDEGIDLIIMATHGRTGLAHLVMGSIAEKVVRHSPIAVLLVKPQDIRENILTEADVQEQLHASLS
jgi:nucleotide-binding universal stress UspA family protein